MKIGKKYWDLEPCRKNTKNDCKLPMIANIVKIYSLEKSYKVPTYFFQNKGEEKIVFHTVFLKIVHKISLLHNSINQKKSQLHKKYMENKAKRKC